MKQVLTQAPSFNHLYVFDLDGTLTRYGFDLWMLTTEQLVTEPQLFNQALKNYLASKADETAYRTDNSKAMMERAIKLLPKDAPAQIFNTALELTLKHQQQDNFIYCNAINLIGEMVDRGSNVVISSANYQEGVLGFVEALVKLGLLSRRQANSIEIHATEICWTSRTVQHLNVGKGKVERLNHHDGSSLTVYGDDIVVNDRALMDLPNAQVKVVRNHNHNDVTLPQHWEFVVW